MTTTTTTTADKLVAHLTPHAARGNTIAATFLARLEAAEDRDAEAEAILADIGRMIAGIAEIGRRLIDAVAEALIELGKAFRGAGAARRARLHGQADAQLEGRYWPTTIVIDPPRLEHGSVDIPALCRRFDREVNGR